MATTPTILASRLMAHARLRHIQILVKIAELGSVVRAANALGLTQPAASHILADLEKLLDCALFQRHARGMTPTPVALALIPYARNMLDSIFGCAEVASAMANSAKSVLRLASITSAVSGILTGTLSAFSLQNPAILINVLETDIYEIGELIARDSIDLAFCREPLTLPEGWEFYPLLKDRYIIVAGPRHPLYKRREITPEMLHEETWIIVPAPSAPKHAFEQLLTIFNFVPRIKTVGTRSQTIIANFLQQERLVTLLPKSIVQHSLDRHQLIELSITVPLSCEPLGIMIPKLDPDSAAYKLSEYLKNHYRY